MSKFVTPAFAAAQAAQVRTFCFVTKVGPFTNGGLYIGLCSLNRDIVYDDGTGPRTYYSRTGTQLSQLTAKIGLSVSNGEAQTLLEQYPGQGITAAMVDSTLSGVEYVVYKVNWADLSPTMGHEHMGSGPVGEARLSRDGLISLELRGWTDFLRQNSVCERDSLTCRVKQFGSQYGDERYPCLKDITGMWVVNVPVTSLGPEPVREFTASSLLQVDGFFAPGKVKAVTGLNASMTREVANFDAGGIIDLMFPFRFAMGVGDLFDIIPDCTREWGRAMPTDPIKMNSCLYHLNHPNFRGEPKIPVADVINLTVPGAGAGGF